jgi:hypothetical protein
MGLIMQMKMQCRDFVRTGDFRRALKFGRTSERQLVSLRDRGRESTKREKRLEDWPSSRRTEATWLVCLVKSNCRELKIGSIQVSRNIQSRFLGSV